jgi:hypothetical protein
MGSSSLAAAFICKTRPQAIAVQIIEACCCCSIVEVGRTSGSLQPTLVIDFKEIFKNVRKTVYTWNCGIAFLTILFTRHYHANFHPPGSYAINLCALSLPCSHSSPISDLFLGCSYGAPSQKCTRRRKKEKEKIMNRGRINSAIFVAGEY